MARYRYKARSLDGRAVEAVVDAADDQALEAQLSGEGLVLISAAAVERRRASSFSQAFFGTGTATIFSTSELILFTMELGTSYKAGLPLLPTIEDMAQTAQSRNIREVARGLGERLRSGTSLADSLAAFPKAFPSLYIELVGAAETTGKLDQVLDDLVTFLEWQKETRGQIVSASAYPIAMVGAVIGLTLVLTLFVFPRFLKTFENMGGDLPMPTKVLLFVEHVFRLYHVPIFAVAVIVPVTYLVVRNIPPVRLRIDLMKLKVPIVGPLLTKLYMSLFAHNLAMMIGSGLDFTTALKLCERILANRVFANLVGDARVQVEQGKPLSDAMAKGNLVPSLVRRMIKLGETTGAMEASLENVSRYYDKEIPRSIKRMFAVMEPLILVVMASVVLFMASAVMLPLYGMINKIGGEH